MKPNEEGSAQSEFELGVPLTCPVFPPPPPRAYADLYLADVCGTHGETKHGKVYWLPGLTIDSTAIE